MKTKVLVVAIALFGASALYWLADPTADRPPAPEPEPSVGHQIMPGEAGEEPTKDEGRDQDSEPVEVVEQELAEARRKNDELIDKSILAVGVNHPYTKYPEATLLSLSYSDAVAAVVLARKTEDSEKARELYERAVALKWRPSPLIEWMTHRNIGGLSWTDGKLDVRAAKIGYKVQLVVQAIAGYDEPMLADYKQALDENGVDTAEIEAEAARYLRDLEEQHVALTGGPRP